MNGCEGRVTVGGREKNAGTIIRMGPTKVNRLMRKEDFITQIHEDHFEFFPNYVSVYLKGPILDPFVHLRFHHKLL